MSSGETRRPPTPPQPTGTDTFTTPTATARRTLLEFRDDGMTDWAAALTYYGLLSLFPALLALSSLIGLIADPETITDVILELAPASAADTLSGPIESITSNTGAAGLGLVFGLAGALWGASGYTSAFARASNVIYEIREGRSFWQLRPMQVLITLISMLLLVAAVAAVVLSGPVVEAVADPLGVGDTAVTVWRLAKWPILIAAAVVLLMLLYGGTPNVRQRRIWAVMPGAAVALVLWVVASAGFALYVSNFGSYDRTYGTLGGVVVLLVWLWITNVALLLGAEYNAERERTYEISHGVSGSIREIQLPPREQPEPPRTR
ncbi:MAG: YihY/virulence factor BrkB family protein [Miltoncostaeaceae bacterium]